MTTKTKRYSKIVDPSGNRFEIKGGDESHRIQAGYDILREEFRNDHWKYATHLSGPALDTYDRLNRIRRLARHEYRNNPHLQGLTNKITHELIGTGPQIEIIPNSYSKRSCRAAQQFESFLNEHFDEIDFVRKLRAGVNEKKIGGEIFNQFRTNPVLDVLPCDFEIYQGEQFQTPSERYRQVRAQKNYPPVDGMELDEYGNVVNYHRLKFHPYQNHNTTYSIDQTDTIESRYIAHEYRKDWPGIYRGVSEALPTLTIYSFMRRFLESTVEHQELKSRMVGVIYSGYAECADIGDDPIEMTIGNGQFLTLPDGWQAQLFKNDTPGQEILDFMKACLGWATQAYLTPWNVAAGDSSDSNFASGRLDYLIWNRVIDDDRDDIRRIKLDRYMRFLLTFAVPMGRIPSGLGAFRWQWHWPKRDPVDIKAQSQADKTYSDAGLLDLDEFAQRQGSNATEMIKRKLRLKFEEEKIKRELVEEYGFELGQQSNETSDKENENDDSEVATTT